VPEPSLDGYAGKNSQKLSDYYERLGANYLGRIENQTFAQREAMLLSPARKAPKPYGTDKKYQASPEYSRFRVDDIDGASPNAFGKARSIKGKDYMQIADIPGARPRYLETEERRKESYFRLRGHSVNEPSNAVLVDRRSKRLRHSVA